MPRSSGVRWRAILREQVRIELLKLSEEGESKGATRGTKQGDHIRTFTVAPARPSMMVPLSHGSLPSGDQELRCP